MDTLSPPPYEDDVALAVWADEALAAGNTLGEFFHLQLREKQGPLPAAAARRMRGLQRQHHHALLGPLEGLLTHVQYRGGLPFSARLGTGRKQLTQHRKDVRWSALEVLDLGPACNSWVSDHPSLFLNGCPALRTVLNLVALPYAECPRITSASVVGETVAASLRFFPALRRLELIGPLGPPSELTDEVLARLERLSLTDGERRITWERGRWQVEASCADEDPLGAEWSEFLTARDAEVMQLFIASHAQRVHRYLDELPDDLDDAPWETEELDPL